MYSGEENDERTKRGVDDKVVVRSARHVYEKLKGEEEEAEMEKLFRKFQKFQMKQKRSTPKR